MIIKTHEDVTASVLSEIERAPNPRFREIMSIKDLQRRPVADAEVDVWNTSAEGLYENQDPTPADMNLRGKSAKLPRPPITGKATGEPPVSVVLERMDLR